jgi:hypothetical protein
MLQIWLNANQPSSTEQIPSCETSSSSRSQEIHHSALNSKVYYRVYRNPPVAIMKQTSPVYAHQFYFFAFYFNIILPLTTRYSKWSYFFRFPHTVLVWASPSCVPHAPPVSIFLIWSPELHLVRSENGEAYNFAVFSVFLLLPLAQAQSVASAPYSGTSWA